MKTENLSTLKIHKLTQDQYDREFAAGRIDKNALYLTPDKKEVVTLTTSLPFNIGNSGFQGKFLESDSIILNQLLSEMATPLVSIKLAEVQITCPLNFAAFAENVMYYVDLQISSYRLLYIFFQDQEGSWSYMSMSNSVLPTVSSDDAGKFLRVSETGEWTLAAISMAQGVEF